MRKILLFGLFVTQFIALIAGNLTPGNIVVVRVGDGSAALTSASTAVFLDEYTPAGGFVQSIAAPTTVSGSDHALTLSGTATSEGELALSANGQYLTFAGYDTATGYAGVSSGITNRTIARVGANGVFNTSTGFLSGSAYVTNNIRSAVTNDGSGFWTGGTGSTGTGGVWYVPFGSFTSAGVQTSTTSINTRSVNIFGGQLYFSTGSVAPGIYADGSGLPTTSGQVSTMLPGLPTSDSSKSPYAFVFLDENPAVAGVDVLYVVDDNTTAPAGGIYKFSLVAGSWVTNGNVANANGLRGITGFNVCSGSQLYVTASAGIYSFFDGSGYNQTITGAYTQIVTAATNTVIRGVAFAPGTITPTAPVASIGSKSNISCHGANNGVINISVSGGVSPITYAWAGGNTSPNRTNLSAGTYTVTVKDFYGCTSSATATISEPAALAIVIDSVTNLPCTGGNTGAVAISVTGGTGNYSYLWSNSATSKNISGLTAGTYRVVVTDSAGCTLGDSAIVSQSGSLHVSDSVTAVSCFGLSDGSIALTVTGGTPNYTYQWSGSSNITANISGLAQGSYEVTVSDQAGCVLATPFVITQPDSLSLSLVAANVSAQGGTDGNIDLTASGGTGPGYTYSWSNGATTQNITGLVAGSYCVTVTDQKSCRDTACASITQPTGIDNVWVNKFSAYTSGSMIIVDLEADREMQIVAELYDLTGKLLYQNSPVHDYKLQLQISDAEISSGCYIIRVATDSGNISKKVVIMK